MALTLSSTRLRMTQAKFFGRYSVASGTVTQITAGAGITLTPNPIVTTGTVAVTAPVTVPLGGTGQTTFGVGYLLFGDAANSIKSDAELFWNNTLKYLGVGGSPSYPLTVVDTVGTTGVDNYASFHHLTKNGSEPATNSVGLLGGITLDLTGAETVANFAGVASRVRVIDAGTGTQGANFTAVASVENTATWNSRIGYYVYDATGAGSLTDQYGVYVPQLSKGSGNNYAIFTAGTTPSVFTGNVQVASDLRVDGKVGIQKAVPTTPLDLESTADPAANAWGGFFKLTGATNTAFARRAISAQVSMANPAGNQTGPVDAIYVNNKQTGLGTTDLFRGVTTSLEVTAGTVALHTPFYVTDATGAGTVTTQYGYYCANLTKGATNYAVYTAGTTPSYFGGYTTLATRVGVGHANTPSREVDIEGTTRYRGIAAPAVSEANSCTIYFDAGANNLKASANGSAYVNVLGSGGVTGTGVATKLTSWSGLTSLEGTANIYVDTANHRLGVKVAAPAYTLDVDGDINLTTSSIIRYDGGQMLGVLNTGAVGIGWDNTMSSANGTAVGYSAMPIASGASNTAVGAGSLSLLTTGASNTALGKDAGNTLTTGSNNVLVGAEADCSANNLTNAVAIGYQASVAASDSMSLGNSSMKVGVRASTPAVAFDVAGPVAFRGVTFVPNPDIGLLSNQTIADYTYLRIEAMSGDFSLGGFTGGVNGRYLTVYNATAHDMTVTNEDMASAATNRILEITGTGVRKIVHMIYDDYEDRWLVVSGN